MTVTAGRLRELAEAYGIALSYEGSDGIDREVPAGAVIAALAAFDVHVASDGDIEEALRSKQDGGWRRPLPPCTVVREGDTSRVTVRLPAGSAAKIRLRLENGDEVPLVSLEGSDGHREIDGVLVASGSFEVPGTVPCGYHDLELVSDGVASRGELIVVPRFLGLPKKLGDARIWGYAVQLYSVRSDASWGIGDLVDLADLAAWSAGQGAGYLLTNPLHASAPTVPVANSPYSPTSRRFVNPIYVRPEAIEGYADLPANVRARVDRLRTTLAEQLATTVTIDRDAIWTAKIAALQAIYDAGVPEPHRVDLDRFVAANDPMLHGFAVWCAVAEVHGPDRTAWPEELREPGSSGVSRFSTRYAARIDFHRWLQWVTDRQLTAAQTRAVEAGMTVGIVNDLAVGVDFHGAEVWADPGHYASGVTIGAPADAYNSLGQGWGLAAWRPDRLAESGYRPFRDLLRSILRSCGGLRVDHIMGLFRLWWIPGGNGPTDGTYVHYDHDAMVGILMLEAARSDALVVGEDLGTVEPWVREYLAERGVLGTSVAWFERGPDGGPLDADRYRALCMASVTTHDLAPTAGYLEGTHVAVRDRLGLLQRPLEAELAELTADLDRWRSFLRSAGHLTDGEGVDATEAEILALHRYLNSSPARVLCAALSDAVGDRVMQNQPGTVDEYPNWRVPLTGADGRPVRVEDLRASDRADRLAAVLDDG